MTSLRGQTSWAQINSLGGGGQANSTGLPPDQISKQSSVTNLSFYKHRFNLIIIMLQSQLHKAMINKNEHSCSPAFYFTATKVK